MQFISITNGAGYNVGGSVISCGRDTTNPRAYDSRNAQTVLPSLAKEISYVISGSEPGMIFECSSGGVWAPCWTTEWLPAGAQMISFGPEGNVAINQPTRAKLVVRWPDDGIYTLNVDALDSSADITRNWASGWNGVNAVRPAAISEQVHIDLYRPRLLSQRLLGTTSPPAGYPFSRRHFQCRPRDIQYEVRFQGSEHENVSCAYFVQKSDNVGMYATSFTEVYDNNCPSSYVLDLQKIYSIMMTQTTLPGAIASLPEGGGEGMPVGWGVRFAALSDGTKNAPGNTALQNMIPSAYISVGAIVRDSCNDNDCFSVPGTVNPTSDRYKYCQYRTESPTPEKAASLYATMSWEVQFDNQAVNRANIYYTPALENNFFISERNMGEVMWKPATWRYKYNNVEYYSPGAPELVTRYVDLSGRERILAGTDGKVVLNTGNLPQADERDGCHHKWDDAAAYANMEVQLISGCSSQPGFDSQVYEMVAPIVAIGLGGKCSSNVHCWTPNNHYSTCTDISFGTSRCIDIRSLGFNSIYRYGEDWYSGWTIEKPFTAASSCDVDCFPLAAGKFLSVTESTGSKQSVWNAHKQGPNPPQIPAARVFKSIINCNETDIFGGNKYCRVFQTGLLYGEGQTLAAPVCPKRDLADASRKNISLNSYPPLPSPLPVKDDLKVDCSWTLSLMQDPTWINKALNMGKQASDSTTPCMCHTTCVEENLNAIPKECLLTGTDTSQFTGIKPKEPSLNLSSPTWTTDKGQPCESYYSFIHTKGESVGSCYNKNPCPSGKVPLSNNVLKSMNDTVINSLTEEQVAALPTPVPQNLCATYKSVFPTLNFLSSTDFDCIKSNPAAKAAYDQLILNLNSDSNCNMDDPTNANQQSVCMPF